MKYALFAAAALLLAPLTVSAAEAQKNGEDVVRERILANFPNTHIASVKCGVAHDMCEITAGPNVFYASPDGRYAFLGTVLDLKDRVNLTDKRVKELAEVESAFAKMGGGDPTRSAAQPTAQPASAGAAPPSVLKVDLARENAIIHHPGAPLKLIAFTDLNCGYCKKLVDELRGPDAADIELTEYPMGFLRADSADKAKLALCASDRVQASTAIYFGGDAKVGSDCSSAAKAVEANTAFGHEHGITGTPMLVRADGQTQPGFIALDQLRAWLKASGGAHS